MNKNKTGQPMQIGGGAFFGAVSGTNIAARDQNINIHNASSLSLPEVAAFIAEIQGLLADAVPNAAERQMLQAELVQADKALIEAPENGAGLAERLGRFREAFRQVAKDSDSAQKILALTAKISDWALKLGLGGMT